MRKKERAICTEIFSFQHLPEPNMKPTQPWCCTGCLPVTKLTTPVVTPLDFECQSTPLCAAILKSYQYFLFIFYCGPNGMLHIVAYFFCQTICKWKIAMGSCHQERRNSSGEALLNPFTSCHWLSRQSPAGFFLWGKKIQKLCLFLCMWGKQQKGVC